MSPRPPTHVQNWSGIVLKDEPIPIHRENHGDIFRAIHVKSGAYKNIRVVFGDATHPPDHKDSYRLDKIGMIVLRDWGRAWLVNTEGLAGAPVALELEFHTRSVGLAQTPLDRRHAVRCIANEEDKSIASLAKLVIAQSWANPSPVAGRYFDREELYWSGSIVGDEAFQLSWHNSINPSGSKMAIVGTVASHLIDGVHMLTLDACRWDFLYAGTGSVEPPFTPFRAPIPIGTRSLLQLKNTSGSPGLYSYNLGTLSK